MIKLATLLVGNKSHSYKPQKEIGYKEIFYQHFIKLAILK
jgi:hypothetical protein